MGRATDFQALERYHKLRDANRALVEEAKAIEKRDLAWLIHQAGEVSTKVKNRLVKSSVAWSVRA